MELRYSSMNELITRCLEGYNQKSENKLPYIVVFIDEMADLMMTAGKKWNTMCNDWHKWLSLWHSFSNGNTKTKC